MDKKLWIATGAALLTLTTAACEKKVGGQVVAVVNGTEITQQELNSNLNGVPMPPSADRKTVVSDVLQGLINRKLLVGQAKADGIDKTPEYLTELSKAQDGLIIKLLQEKIGKTVAVPDNAAVQKFIADNPSLFESRKRFSLDQLAFPNPGNQKVLKDLEPTHSLDEIAKVLTSNNIPFKRGQTQLDSATIPPEMFKKISSLPAGEPFVLPNRGGLVASVITAVTANPTAPDQANAAAANLVRQKEINEAMNARLEAARKMAKIDVQAGLKAN